jgi:3-methylcrotonyl-CoA carboxylase alpha subunit
VHLQLHVAAGGRLEQLLAGRDLRPRGHAIEARICAEAPENGYVPAAGVLRYVRDAEGPGVRVDSGVYGGWEVPPFYDSMLAKLVVWAPDRASACARLSQALRDTCYLGIPTNIDFLRRVVDDAAFREARLSTDLLAHRPELAAGGTAPPGDDVLAAAVLCQALGRADNGRGANGANGDGAGGRDGDGAAVWHAFPGFRAFGGGR